MLCVFSLSIIGSMMYFSLYFRIAFIFVVSIAFYTTWMSFFLLFFCFTCFYVIFPFLRLFLLTSSKPIFSLVHSRNVQKNAIAIITQSNLISAVAKMRWPWFVQGARSAHRANCLRFVLIPIVRSFARSVVSGCWLLANSAARRRRACVRALFHERLHRFVQKESARRRRMADQIECSRAACARVGGPALSRSGQPECSFVTFIRRCSLARMESCLLPNTNRTWFVTNGTANNMILLMLFYYYGSCLAIFWALECWFKFYSNFWSFRLYSVKTWFWWNY